MEQHAASPVVSTKVLMRRVEECTTLDEYFKLTQENQACYQNWADKIQAMMREKKLTRRQLAADCCTSEPTVRSWLSRIPPKRAGVIAIAMSLGCTAAETDLLLTRYAKFQKLYAKSMEDAVYLYLIEHCGKRSMADQSPYRLYGSLFQRCLELQRRALTAAPAAQTDGTESAAPRRAQMPTAVMRGQISDAATQDAFDAFVNSHAADFHSQPQKLLDYLDKWLSGEALGYILADQWDKDMLMQYVSRLRCGKDAPRRELLITLALKLRMPEENINEFLACAGFSELSPKDRLEGSVIFLLQQLFLTQPSLFGVDTPGSRELIEKNNPNWSQLDAVPLAADGPRDEECWDSEAMTYEDLLTGALGEGLTPEQRAQLARRQFNSIDCSDDGLKAYIRWRLNGYSAPGEVPAWLQRSGTQGDQHG